MGALRRLPLEGAIRLAVPTTIVLVALGSNWSPSVRSVAQPLWRLSLALFCGLAVVLALTRVDRRELLRRTRSPWYTLAAALVGVGAASALWSVDTRLTLERLLSFALVLLAAGSLGVAAAGNRPLVERLLVSVLAGAVAIAVLGLIVLVVAHGDAVQEATKTVATRYRGIGQNPNTVAMLFAAALPLAAWLVLERRGRARVAAIAAVALLGGSIVGSGSRGALGVAFVDSLLVVLVAAHGQRQRLRAAAIAGVAFAAAIGLAALPQPNASVSRVTNTACVDCKASRFNADRYFRLEDELDAPRGADPGQKRTFFASTGRTQAWRGAIRQGRDRLLLGYGFGTEDRVFVDRYYSFFGGTPENSYVGMFLQLGLLGVLLLVALGGTLAYGSVSAVRGLAVEARPVAAACAAVVAAGLALAFVQSYLVSVGNATTLTIWLCAFLGVALAAARR